MTETSPTLAGLVDERLAMLWYQVDRAGDRGLRREIEEVADRFMFPGDTAINDKDIENAHEVFRRVHAKYTQEIQTRLGLRLVRCPHCRGEEVKEDG